MSFSEQVKSSLLDIISMEAGSVKEELLKFFSYDKFTSSNSAFFQQRATFTRNPLDTDSYFAPDGKTTNGCENEDFPELSSRTLPGRFTLR